MLIKSARLKWVSDELGYGLFASEFIPMGTLIYVRDPLDIQVSEKVYHHSPTLRSTIDKYSYEDGEGHFVVCWDLGKYMNHCCHPNTLSTGYEFEIAVRDISVDEEITDDYRLFSSTLDFSPSCSKTLCPSYEFSAQLIDSWDSQIKLALKEMDKVDQPLYELIDPSVRQQITELPKKPNSYISVSRLLNKKPKLS